MRFSEKCPKCEGREFAVNTEMLVSDYDGSRYKTPLFAINLAKAAMLDRRSDLRQEERGFFEAWICLGCGYTELYAGGLDGVRELAAKYPEQLRIVDANNKDGPYR
jgi:predicted nucleic-acid-binding Zn-ribbon protein